MKLPHDLARSCPLQKCFLIAQKLFSIFSGQRYFENTSHFTVGIILADIQAHLRRQRWLIPGFVYTPSLYSLISHDTDLDKDQWIYMDFRAGHAMIWINQITEVYYNYHSDSVSIFSLHDQIICLNFVLTYLILTFLRSSTNREWQLHS